MAKKIMITIPDEMAHWLERHKEINKSGLFQNAVIDMRKRMERGDSQ
jgi:hypothetical protein